MAASSSRLRTVEDGSFGPIRASETDDLAFHLATVFGLIPYRRQQIVAILVQAINGARIFGTVFLGEGLECKLRDSPARRYRDVLQGFLHAALHGRNRSGRAPFSMKITRPGRAFKPASASGLGHPSRPPYCRRCLAWRAMLAASGGIGQN